MFVTYQNDRFDYLKIETTETFYVVERTGTGGVRTDAIFVEEGESITHILRYDTHEKEPSAHMEQASISEAKASPRLYLHAAETLKMLTQMEIGMDTLNCDMSKIAHYITGLSIDSRPAGPSKTRSSCFSMYLEIRMSVRFLNVQARSV